MHKLSRELLSFSWNPTRKDEHVKKSLITVVLRGKTHHFFRVIRSTQFRRSCTLMLKVTAPSDGFELMLTTCEFRPLTIVRNCCGFHTFFRDNTSFVGSHMRNITMTNTFLKLGAIRHTCWPILKLHKSTNRTFTLIWINSSVRLTRTCLYKRTVNNGLCED